MPARCARRTKLIEGQRVEPPHHLLLEFEPQRAHDLMTERAAGRVGDRVLRGLEPPQRAHDVAEADAPPLAGQPIAAARAADPDKDLVPHQLLQHRLEVAAGNALARGDLGRTHRRGDRRYRRCRAPPRSRTAVSWLTGSSFPNRHPVIPGLVGTIVAPEAVGTSGSDAGRAEAAFLPAAGLGKRGDDREVRPRNAGKDELGDAVAGPDLDRVTARRRIAVPRRDQQRPLVIGVDDARPCCRAPAPLGDRGRNAAAPARTIPDRRCERRCRRRSAPPAPAAAGRAARRGRRADRGRPRGSTLMRKPPAGQARSRIFSSIFTASRPPMPERARHALGEPSGDLLLGHGRPVLDPVASTRWIVLRSPPKVPVPGETSLARIQSQPLRSRLRRALATIFSVSAAKPMTSAGRSLLRARCATGCRGSRRGAAPAGRSPSFFSFWGRRSRPASRRPPPPSPRHRPATPPRRRRASPPRSRPGPA